MWPPESDIPATYRLTHKSTPTGNSTYRKVVLPMKITYIYHSGFLIELEHAILLFDYYKGELEDFDSNKQIYVFSSHAHPDHFNKDIFNLSKIYQNVTYVLSSDISSALEKKDIITDLSEKTKENIFYLKPNEEKLFAEGKIVSDISGCDIGVDKCLKVKTFESTDLGVAFFVTVEGNSIFHAGDLHWWTWPGESKQEYQSMTDRFFAEVAKISKEQIDIAFLPLDSRQEDRFYWGFDYYMQTCDIKLAFPMHFWDDFSLIKKFKNMEESQDYLDKIMDIEKNNQTFII